MTITVGEIFPLFLDQGIIMFLEVGLEPMFLEVGLEPTIDLVVGLPEVGVLIHTIMIPLHREGRIMTVGIAFQIEAEIIPGFKEAEVIMV